LTERHATQIVGVLGCFDRMLIFGTLPGVCFAGGMTSFLFERKIRIFDYPKFANPYRNQTELPATLRFDFNDATCGHSSRGTHSHPSDLAATGRSVIENSERPNVFVTAFHDVGEVDFFKRD